MTGHASIDSAIDAVKLGALDYLSKPLDLRRLKELLDGVRYAVERRRRLLAADREVANRLKFHGIIGRSPAMQDLFDRMRRLAPYIQTALVTGETGTGKELVARALHALSGVRDQRFVSCNCAAVAESLFESTFFGHVRGAFTGAHEARPGLFEYAHGGSLFLDEVGELPAPMQPKLLRVLEYGEFQRVGATEARRVQVRTVAATNRHLPTEVAAGRFREDLYYRLNVVEFHLPALRERREDIAYLSAAFVQEFGTRFGKVLEGFTAGAERLLHDAPWRGNVRELRHTLERACIMAEGHLLTERDISSAFGAAANGSPAAPRTAERRERSPELQRRTTPDEIHRVLEGVGGNRSAAARVLGLSRRSFYRRMAAAGIDQTMDAAAVRPHDSSSQAGVASPALPPE
jgi:DNA-binding NtrC family response regulator